MDNKVREIIEKLDLKPHHEGGYYLENYRSKVTRSKEALDENYSGDRYYATGIYFLLTSGFFSAFHRIKQDETWHFTMAHLLKFI